MTRMTRMRLDVEVVGFGRKDPRLLIRDIRGQNRNQDRLETGRPGMTPDGTIPGYRN